MELFGSDPAVQIRACDVIRHVARNSASYRNAVLASLDGTGQITEVTGEDAGDEGIQVPALRALAALTTSGAASEENGDGGPKHEQLIALVDVATCQ